jgi:hypothetical protein
MKDLHYVDLSTSQEYKFQNNKEDLMTSTDNSFGTESVSSTSAPQQGGFFWGANGSNRNDDKCLIAARTKDYGVVDFMLNHDMLSELSSQDEEGSTLLHYLARDFSVNSKANAIISSLLKRNDVLQFINIQDKNGDTPLIAAVKAGNMSLSEQLISSGANRQIKNNDGLYVGSESERGTNSNTQTSSRVTSEKELTESINDMVNMFVKMGRPVVIDTDIEIMNTESANMPDHLSITESLKSHVDTSDNVSSFSIKDTDTFLNMLEHKYIKGAQQGGSYQKGGVKQVRIGNRTLRYYGNEGSYEGTASDAELSRMIDNQASDIHKRVVEKIMDILSIDEKIARNYKAAIYKEVRDEQPNLANLDRAVEMEKRITKDKLKSIDIKKVTKEIEKHLQEKDKERADNKNDDKKPVVKKDSKKSAKKSAKKVQTESEGISATSVGSPNNGVLSETSLSDSSFDDEE